MADNENAKSLESWLWDAACSIRGAQEAPKFKDFILPLVFTKRLCDVFDDEIDRISEEVGSRAKAFKLVTRDQSLVRFYLPLKPEDPDDQVWSVIRRLSDRIGEQLTTHLRQIAKANPLLQGIIDRIDFNATTHGQRDIDDDRLSNLIERISVNRLGLKDVEPDIIGRSYEYLIRKFAEGSGKSAGEFYTPKEVGMVMARIMDPQPGMAVYDPCCGSAGLLIKCQLVLGEGMAKAGEDRYAPLQLLGQEYIGSTWAMANMNMIIHDMEGRIEIGDSFRSPKFRQGGRLETFDRVVANPMWNQDWFTEQDYETDELGRFTKGPGFPGERSADWGWLQHILASLGDHGRAAVVLDAAAISRGSGDDGENREREIRKAFVEEDLIETVILLPDDLFYNTTAQGIIVVLSRQKPKERQERILLIDASLSFVRERPKNLLSADGSARIVAAFFEWRCEPGFSRVVTLEEVASRDYNLNPARYIELVGEREAVDVEATLAELSVLRGRACDLDAAVRECVLSLKRAAEPASDATPAGWSEYVFGEIADFSLGRTPPRKRRDYFTTEPADAYPWVTISDMSGHETVTGTKEYVTKAGFEDVFKGRLVPAGTLLMSIKLTVGRTAFLGVDGLHNEAIVSITPDGDYVLSQFLYYALPVINYREHQDRAVKGQTINLGKLRKMTVTLPPVAEQLAIVEVLSSVSELLRVENRILDRRRELQNELVLLLSSGSARTQSP